MAIAHFAFGAGVTTLLVTFLVPITWYPRTLSLAGGGWAMLPDAYWVSPIAADRLSRIHQHSVCTDVFWLHRTWDRIDPTDSKAIAAVLVAFFVLATLLAERRGYRTLDRIEAAYDAHLDVGSEE